VSYHANIIVRQSIQAAGGLAYLFWLNGKMAAAAMFGLLLMGAISHFNGAYSRWLATKITDETADANAVAEQALGLVRLVRTHAAEGVEAAKYSGKLGNIMALEEAQVRAGGGYLLAFEFVASNFTHARSLLTRFFFLLQGWGYGLGRALSAVASCAVTSAVLLTGQRAVTSGALNGEGVTAFFFYVAFVAGSSFDVGEQWTRIQQALGAGKSVFAMASREPVRFRDTEMNPAAVAAAAEQPLMAATSRHEPEAALSALGNPIHGAAPAAVAAAAKLELADVHFEYPGRPGAAVLKGLTLAVRPGEVVGLVGGSGGGKSTVLRLLCGFYAAQRGRVLLNGKDVLRDYSPAELARTIAWVTQEPQLFPVSVAENIAYGLPVGSWTMDDVERCVRVP
jgi:ABC-type multidrug transport system fused ATPase/permease subunit